MSEPVWLDKRAVLVFHNETLAQHGGPSGVRDEGLLESALARARNAYPYGEEDLCALASLYVHGVVKNHPFVDGNKRTGFLCGALFLELNRLRFEGPEPEVVAMTLALASGEADEKAYAEWLRAWTS
ncbi:MAG: type II toxin-antitoxin system death-on-curing family toxin [Alphaproteobacteria bacterium]|nr:type II toxin-antitoxin system death-on-curing family toxin [Alphaproteobacteria bacterium]